MQSFEYAAPDTLEEALALLRAHGAEAKVLAGGQSLVPLLNYGLAGPRLVVDIPGLPLAHVRAEDGWLRVGGLARHHELEELTEIARACPLLPEVARLIGNVRVRSLGTVGGSLAHADPAAELPLAMVALDARLTLASASGRRMVAARDFFTGYLSTVLGADELLTEIAVPVTRGMGWAVEEFARRAGDFAVVAVAAGVSLDRRGRVDDARVTFAGVADRPVRATAAEDALRGQEPSADRLARAAEIARDGLDHQSDAFVSGAYRRLLAGVLARRALGRAVALSAAPSSEGAAAAPPADDDQRAREGGGRSVRRDAARDAAEYARDLRRQGGLRRGRLRRVHGAARRPAGVELPRAGGRGARAGDPHRPRARARRGAPSAPGGVRPARRRPVWVLHPGDAAHCAGFPRAPPSREPRRGSRGARG